MKTNARAHTRRFVRAAMITRNTPERRGCGVEPRPLLTVVGALKLQPSLAHALFEPE